MVLRDRRERKLAETCMVSHRSFTAAYQGSDFTFTFQNPEFLGERNETTRSDSGLATCLAADRIEAFVPGRGPMPLARQ